MTRAHRLTKKKSAVTTLAESNAQMNANDINDLSHGYWRVSGPPFLVMAFTESANGTPGAGEAHDGPARAVHGDCDGCDCQGNDTSDVAESGQREQTLGATTN